MENDWDVTRVEKLYWVCSVVSFVVLVADLDFIFESLEVDDNEEDNESGDQVEKVSS